MKNIAVLGYGTVGSGVVEVLRTNQEVINKRAGEEVHLKYVLDLREFPGDPVEKVLVHDYDTILNDDQVEIIVEVMGGVNPAYKFVKEALLKGKSVCTSNKELVAKHGAELLAIAKEKKINFLFEASVGGGIPIIRPLISSVTADEILEISGILNGTTNFILSKMDREGLPFETVLKEAQDLGYAEKNPAADVEGHDACRKIAILSSLACGAQVDFEEIPTEGITKITDVDFRYANELGVAIKLIGTSKKTSQGYSAMVAPKMIGKQHPLAGVNDVMNAIFVKGNCLGDVMFYGSGAGKLPTASAVVSDVVDCVKHMGIHITTIWSQEKAVLAKAEDLTTRFFIRFIGKVSTDRIQEIETVLGKGKIITLSDLDQEFAFITDMMTEGDYAKAAAQLSGIIGMIRFEN